MALNGRRALLSLRLIGAVPKSGLAACLTRFESRRLRNVACVPLFARHLGAADPVAVENLVVVHRDGDLHELAGEFERRPVVRDR